MIADKNICMCKREELVHSFTAEFVFSSFTFKTENFISKRGNLGAISI